MVRADEPRGRKRHEDNVTYLAPRRWVPLGGEPWTDDVIDDEEHKP